MIHNEVLSLIKIMAIYFPVLTIIFTFRGFFKTIVAWSIGDSTAIKRGFLTLNPFTHIHILGMGATMTSLLFLVHMFDISLPQPSLIIFMLVLSFRWTKQIPTNQQQFKCYRIGGVLTSLAGSLGNIVLVILVLLVVKYLPLQVLPLYKYKTISDLLRNLIDTALWFTIIDLIPLPPFDGGKAIRYLLPQSQQYLMDRLEKLSLSIILILFFIPGVGNYFWEFLHTSMWTVKNFLITLLS